VEVAAHRAFSALNSVPPPAGFFTVRALARDFQSGRVEEPLLE